MKNRKTIEFWAVFPVIVFLLTGLILYGKEGKSTNESESQRLIRLDLLKNRARDLSVPLRNIFIETRAKGVNSLKNTLSSSIEKSGGILDIEGGENFIQSEGINPEKRGALEFRYLGCIASSEKKVALIFYRGEALVVEKGSFLPEGSEIIDITLNEVTLKGPGADKIVIKLEGVE
jgi:hypothetical protein